MFEILRRRKNWGYDCTKITPDFFFSFLIGTVTSGKKKTQDLQVVSGSVARVCLDRLTHEAADMKEKQIVSGSHCKPELRKKLGADTQDMCEICGSLSSSWNKCA